MKSRKNKKNRNSRTKNISIASTSSKKTISSYFTNLIKYTPAVILFFAAIIPLINEAPKAIERYTKEHKFLVALNPTMIDPKTIKYTDKTLVLDNDFKQSLFYKVPKIISENNDMLIHLPFAIINNANEDSKNVILNITFKNSKIYDEVFEINYGDFNSPNMEFFPVELTHTFDADSIDLELDRKLSNYGRSAVASYSISNLHSTKSNYYEIHFRPTFSEVLGSKVNKYESKVEFAFYEVEVEVKSEKYTQIRKFNIFIIPSSSIDEFNEIVQPTIQLISENSFKELSYIENLGVPLSALIGRTLHLGAKEHETLSIFPKTIKNPNFNFTMYHFYGENEKIIYSIQSWEYFWKKLFFQI